MYMESRKMVLMNLFSGQQWRNSHREQISGHGEGEEGEGWVAQEGGDMGVPMADSC